MSHSILPQILRKRDGHELSPEEIEDFVEGVTAGAVPDYQIGAMLMAIFFRGMSDRETSDLTRAMVYSGEVLDLSAIPGFKADKHSTGGVGDKVTPILGPLVASAGVYFPKLSGRGLGHTGGTLDKLESIPGFRVDLSIEEFIRQVRAIGLAVNGQTPQLVPADGVLYGLRDVTGTVESTPLIASSVMSKKIAAGADGIVLDVKCGAGAFMRNRAEAVTLARLMVAIGKTASKRVTAIVTAMEEPLGYAIGNALEIAEAIAVLKNQPFGPGCDQTLRDVCLLLGAYTLMMAGIAPTIELARQILEERLVSGAALEKLRAMIEWQGGDPAVIDDPELLPQAAAVVEVPAPYDGYVQRIDARRIGLLAMALGAGRQTKGQPVDHAVGVLLGVQVGDRVAASQPLGFIYTNHKISDSEAISLFLDAITLGPAPPQRVPHVLDVVTDA